MDYLLLFSVLVSFLMNIYFIFKLSKTEKQAQEKISAAYADVEAKKKEVLTVDAQQILHDMTHGGAVIRIIPIDPTQMFYRAPKG